MAIFRIYVWFLGCNKQGAAKRWQALKATSQVLLIRIFAFDYTICQKKATSQPFIWWNYIIIHRVLEVCQWRCHGNTRDSLQNKTLRQMVVSGAFANLRNVLLICWLFVPQTIWKICWPKLWLIIISQNISHRIPMGRTVIWPTWKP